MINKIIKVIFLVICSFNLRAQTISPATTELICPMVTMTMTFTFPGVAYDQSKYFVGGSGYHPTIISGIYGFDRSTANTIFKVDCYFIDANTTQTIEVQRIESDNVTHFYPFKYNRIKSFFYGGDVFNADQPHPSYSNISIPLCHTQTYNVLTPNIAFENDAADRNSNDVIYGDVSTFEYRIPLGWTLNAVTSTGAWIPGSGNVSISTDLTTGAGQFVEVRGVNPCGSNLAKGPITRVAISRPGMTFPIDGMAAICKNITNVYTINNLPANTNVTWDVGTWGTIISQTSNGSSVSIQAPQTGSFILKATVNYTSYPDCGGAGIYQFPISVNSTPSYYTQTPFWFQNGIKTYLNDCNIITEYNRPFLSANGFVDDASGGTGTWSVVSQSPAGHIWSYGFAGNTFNVMIKSIYPHAYIVLRYTVRNACNIVGYRDYRFQTAGPCFARGIENKIKIHPNPSTGKFSVELVSADATLTIKEVGIKNRYGTSVYHRVYNPSRKIELMDMSTSPADIYYISVYDGIEWISEPVTIIR